MNIKTLVTSLVIGASLFGATASMAQADERITLGRTILLEVGNHAAKIPLLVCRKANAIKVKAERDLRLEHMVIKFRNGETKRINFYRDLKKGQETKWRPFAYQRCVKNIEVYGNSEGSRAGLKVYGNQK